MRAIPFGPELVVGRNIHFNLLTLATKMNLVLFFIRLGVNRVHLRPRWGSHGNKDLALLVQVRKGLDLVHGDVAVVSVLLIRS